MKIIIIDDDEVSLFLTQQMLALSGVTNNAHTFLSAEEALKFIQTVTFEDLPDVVLLDLNMPLINGWELLDKLAPHWERVRMKCRIFILTSSLDSSDQEKAKSNPMVSGLIHKPINRENIRLVFSH